jgi:hypothetical protein
MRLTRWLPPVAAYLASTGVAWLVAALSGERFWSVAGRTRWDSEHYLSIAASGYEMFRCRDRYPSFPDVWCGNTAWFPGYPAAVRAVAGTGLPTDVAAILVTEASLLGVFAALWWLVGSRLTTTSAWVLALAVVFPGGIYLHTVFPIALGTLALLVCLVGIRRESWPVAATGGFVATACHLVGAVAPVTLALSVLFAWRGSPWPVRVAKAAGSAALAASAYAVTLWAMWVGTGRWDAYQEHQSSAYGQGGLRNPVTELRSFHGTPFAEWFPGSPDDTWLVRHATSAHQPQLVLNVALVLVLVAVYAWRGLSAHDLQPLDHAAMLLVLGVFGVPFLGGAELSWYRNHAMMLAGLPLLRSGPSWLLPLLVVPLGVQYALLGAMWFSGSLI